MSAITRFFSRTSACRVPANLNCKDLTLLTNDKSAAIAKPHPRAQSVSLYPDVLLFPPCSRHPCSCSIPLTFQSLLICYDDSYVMTILMILTLLYTADIPSLLDTANISVMTLSCWHFSHTQYCRHCCHYSTPPTFLSALYTTDVSAITPYC